MTAVTLDIARKPSAEAPGLGPARQPVIGLTRAELTETLGLAGVPERQRRMRMRQIWSWLYHRGVTSFAQMSDISKDLRQKLDEVFVIERLEVVTEQISSDGTRKWLLKMPRDGRGQRHEGEMVYIPE
ncbi:MAG TPA: 23S rRNA (adenine(2503)-C(2))-methyltransferase RlmN, partial [Nordella sp.]|nr:23S rRNA (adenine(2503)-C(2))-methyltransferase RlmN [Nordella sp.]